MATTHTHTTRDRDGVDCVIAGCSVQQDMSGGQGHCWRTPDRVPASIEEEIAAAIIDGGTESCADYVASNGQHYRWS